MDVLDGAGPAPGDILGELGEPMGMTDYEVIRIAHEIGKRGFTSFSFACIPVGPENSCGHRKIVMMESMDCRPLDNLVWFSCSYRSTVGCIPL